MQLVCKRCSKRKDQHIPYGERCKSTAAHEIYPQEAQHWSRGWTTKWEVVMFAECGGYNYKGTKTQKNQGQEFVSEEYLRNV